MWILLVAFVAFAGWNYYQDNYVPKPFVQEVAHAPGLFKLELRGEHVDDPWLDEFFSLPVQAAHTVPEGEDALPLDVEDPVVHRVTELGSEACGSCHADQFKDWSGSRHAKAHSPALAGQLADMPADQSAECQTCHTPLVEQLATLADGSENPAYVEGLEAEGVNCATCHVRDGKVYGAEDIPAGEDTPHGGSEGHDQFEDSRYCITCHEFDEEGTSFNSKLLQETYQEWLRTGYAEQGVDCQACHMPKGRHSWQGVHDKSLVAQSITTAMNIELAGAGFLEPINATFSVGNRGAAHRMPTYSTAEFTVSVEQVDAAGVAIEGTRQEGVVARRLSKDQSREMFDTRLMPGQTFDLAYSATRAPEAVSLHAQVQVHPQAAWQQRMERMLKQSDNHPQGLAQLEEAVTLAQATGYLAWEDSFPLDETALTDVP